MATANLPPRPADAADPRVLHPLDRLRGTIRLYVVAEAALLAGIFVAVWFAGGLLLDYGLFKLTAFDWVLQTPWQVRGLALAAMFLLLVGLVLTRLVLRLTREFSYPALALVLERRFPKELGDRLITAVELADVGRQARYGYSGEMIRQTITEARERVERVPVNGAFNWGRLRFLAGSLVLLVFGTAALGLGLFAFTGRSAGALAGGWQFAHVSTIWAERNLLLMSTPWPRQAHLEVVGFPESGELRIGKDATAPKVRVRACRWVVADRGVREGWRAMTWADLKPVLGIAPPELSFANADGTVDRVEGKAAEASADVRRALDELNAAADSPSMGRTVRRLEVPEAVTLKYEGAKTSGGGTMAREPDNEFAAEVAGLKESVAFAVTAADFTTASRRITLVPPPMLSRLARTEYQPAYLHHASPSDAGFPALKGLVQRMPEKDLSLTGDKSVFSVPAGTELVLTATTDKPIREAYLKPLIGKVPGGPADAAGLVPVPVNAAGDGFEVAFRGADRPAANTEFALVFVDHDGVRSARPVLIQVTEDRAPEVEVAVDTLRKVGNVYYVTPAARIPFVGESVVKDDAALSKVEYLFTHWKVESAAQVGFQAQLVAAAIAPPLPAGFTSGVTPAYGTHLTRLLARGDDRQTGTALVGGFYTKLAALRHETTDLLRKRLDEPLPDGPAEVVKRVEFKSAETDFFDLKIALPTLGVLPGEVQPRYRVDLDVQATDANFETGPRTARNVEPLRLLVVSEADLLAEINKEEETLTQKLDEAIKKLKEAKTKLTQVTSAIDTTPPNEIITLAVGGGVVVLDTGKGRDVTQGVLVEYRRILRECEVNRVQPKTIERYRNEIVNRLNDVMERHFPNAEKAQADFLRPFTENRKTDPPLVQAAHATLDTLIRELQTVRDALGEALSLDKLRNDLRKLLEAREQAAKVISDLSGDLQRRLFVPEVRPIGAVFLGKGESKKVKHAVDLKLFEGDLVIKLASSDPEVKVPAEVKVTDDMLDAEYTITAGTKAGDFTVTLTPQAKGATPVRVQVTVK